MDFSTDIDLPYSPDDNRYDLRPCECSDSHCRPTA